MLDIVDLLHPDGTPNPSGLGQLHGYAIFPDFAPNGIKKPAAITDADVTAAAAGSIATAHTFAAGKCMKKLYGTVNKGEAKDDSVGDDDSENSKGTVTIMYPGSKKELLGIKRRLNGLHGLAFISLADGQVLQYGSELFPAHFRASWASGTNEGYRGLTITITSYGDAVEYTPGLNFTPAA